MLINNWNKTNMLSLSGSCIPQKVSLTVIKKVFLFFWVIIECRELDTPRNREIMERYKDTCNYTLQGARTGWLIWQLYKGCIGGTVRRWLLRCPRRTWGKSGRWSTIKVDRWQFLVLTSCVKNCLGPLKKQIHDFLCPLKCLYRQQGFYSYGNSILCKKVF